MNYYALKIIREKINTQKLKVAAARDQTVSLSASSDGTPRGGSVSDRVGIGVGKVISEEEKLNALYDQLIEEIKSVPDEYIKTLIHCKLVKGWSWNRIAMEVGGGNAGDS